MARVVWFVRWVLMDFSFKSHELKWWQVILFGYVSLVCLPHWCCLYEWRVHLAALVRYKWPLTLNLWWNLRGLNTSNLTLITMFFFWFRRCSSFHISIYWPTLSLEPETKISRWCCFWSSSRYNSLIFVHLRIVNLCQRLDPSLQLISSHKTSHTSLINWRCTELHCSLTNFKSLFYFVNKWLNVCTSPTADDWKPFKSLFTIKWRSGKSENYYALFFSKNARMKKGLSSDFKSMFARCQCPGNTCLDHKLLD